MYEGEVRELTDADIIADLTRAGYIEEVKPATPKAGRTGRKTN